MFYLNILLFGYYLLPVLRLGVRSFIGPETLEEIRMADGWMSPAGKESLGSRLHGKSPGKDSHLLVCCLVTRGAEWGRQGSVFKASDVPWLVGFLTSQRDALILCATKMRQWKVSRSNCPAGWGLGTISEYQGKVRLERRQPSKQTKSDRMKADFFFFFCLR